MEKEPGRRRPGLPGHQVKGLAAQIFCVTLLPGPQWLSPSVFLEWEEEEAAVVLSSASSVLGRWMALAKRFGKLTSLGDACKSIILLY